jgi:hypothetical protein
MIRGKVHFFFVNKDFMRIYMNQVSSPVGSRCQAPDGLMDIMETYREWWRKIFRDGIRRGDFKKHDPERLLDTVTGMTNELLANALNDASSSEDELVEYILAFLAGGLIRKDPST